MVKLFSFSFQNNTGQAGGVPKLDLNVEAAWALGYTGEGVTTAIMDDGNSCFYCLCMNYFLLLYFT